MSAQDPRKKFSNKDFPKQEQPVPGLQQQLDPQPDCGESSYTGHHRLEGYKMLVTGGDSAIGRLLQLRMQKKVPMLQLITSLMNKSMLKK